MTKTQDEKKITDAFKGKKILVIGDVMIDRYLKGKVSRISPEGPVPVVEIEEEEARMGGSANVGLNVISLGGKPLLCGVVGTDRDGEALKSILTEKGFDISGIYTSEKRKTTSKIRVIGNNQQIVRVDREHTHALDPEEKKFVLDFIRREIKNCHGVIFEDYDKGVISQEIIREVIELAESADIPVVVDPKRNNFLHYTGCTLFKPNIKELNDALNIRLGKNDIAGILESISALRKMMPHSLTVITLSENGLLAIDEEMNAQHFPGVPRNVADVSGAGDTVIGVLGLALSADMNLFDAAEIANLAGGIVCEEVGVVPILPDVLEKEFRLLKGN